MDNRFHDSPNGSRLAELITCLMGKTYINFIVLPETLLLKLMSVPAINLGQFYQQLISYFITYFLIYFFEDVIIYT